MHLTYRPAQISDITVCLNLLPGGFQCEPNLRTKLAELWRTLLRDGLMQLTVVEDEHRPEDQRIVAFGNSVFVTDDFMAEVNFSIEPPASVSVVQRALKDPAFILNPAQVRRANSSGGLNLLVVVIGWNEPLLGVDELRFVKAKLLEAFFFTHAGYFIKEISQEVYSREEMERGLAIGTVLKNDFAAYYEAHPSSAPAPSLRPFQLGIRRDEVRDGSHMSPLFLYVRPRFFFGPIEQEVLRLALIDQTDSEIADQLGISLSAVHKRWQSILDRASTSTVTWLPNSAAASVQSGQVRGAEKRRHLLSYLRSHPEELRPVLPA